MKILGISGSLRKDSMNTALLRAVGEMFDKEVELQVADLSGLPLYNDDLLADLPAAVVAFKDQIKNADAVLIASPEYNYSISGVLKNAIDWASRPKGTNSFDGKPGAIMGVSNGRFGTARAYYDAYKIFGGLNVFIMNYPNILVTNGNDKFSQDGKLTDQETREKLKQFAPAFIEWIKKIKQAGLAK